MPCFWKHFRTQTCPQILPGIVRTDAVYSSASVSLNALLLEAFPYTDAVIVSSELTQESDIVLI